MLETDWLVLTDCRSYAVWEWSIIINRVGWNKGVEKWYGAIWHSRKQIVPFFPGKYAFMNSHPPPPPPPPAGGGGGALTYLKVIGNFPVNDPQFWHFLIPLGLHFIAQLDPIDPLFIQKKKFLSIPNTPTQVHFVFVYIFYFRFMHFYIYDVNLSIGYYLSRLD